MGISFGGTDIRRPGAFSQVDTANMTPVAAGAFRALAFIGAVGTGATIDTDKVSYFNSPSLAREAIGESELLDCMYIAWAHGADLIAVAPAAVTSPATAPTDAEWQKAIDMLEAEFVDGIVPVTVAPAVHAKVDAHITSMSTIKNRRERRGFYGHDKDMTVEEITALQTALASERGMMLTPTVFYTDAATGDLVEKGSHYLAAAVAGIWASQSPEVPITYKYVKFSKLGRVYNGVEIEDLLEGHICPVEYVRNKGFRIVQGITLAASEDLTKHELSVSTLKDTMSKAMREFFEEKYVGQAGIRGIEITMHNDAITLLDNFVRNGWIVEYVPDSVRVTKRATAYELEAEVKPTLPINNFFITSHYTL